MVLPVALTAPPNTRMPGAMAPVPVTVVRDNVSVLKPVIETPVDAPLMMLSLTIAVEPWVADALRATERPV
ncbi:hypothetical protein D3C87_1896910 [compost metagenome]